MTLHVYEDVEQRSDAWHDLRRGMVTASTVGRLVTPKTVKPASNDDSRGAALTLAAERITGMSEPSFINADMQRGIEHEPYARDAYAEKYGVEVTEVGFMARDFDGFTIGYSPDGLVADDGLIEIKCPRPKAHVKSIVTNSVPSIYMAQIQAALLVSGREWVDFVSFVGGLPLFTKRVGPDARWFDAITEAAEMCEKAINQIVTDYEQATHGLPLTERVPDLDLMVI